MADLLGRRLPRVPGVHSAAASVWTGNVLVTFDLRQVNVEAIVAAIGDCLDDPSLVGPGMTVGTPIAAASRRPETSPVRRVAPPGGLPSEDSWHLKSWAAVVGELGGDERHGLAQAEAASRLAAHGPNTLPEAAPRSGLSIFVEQFQTLPVGLLSVSAAISVVTGGILDALVIMGVVVINACIGYVTESQAERTIHALAGARPPPCRVLRDGGIREVPCERLVVGDVLVLGAGSYVGADARLISVDRLTVDESVLTGESLPVTKMRDPLSDPALPLADRLNMVHMGTTVTGGSAYALVVATAERTQIGIVQRLMGEARAPETPMQRQLHRMGTQTVILSSAICGGVFAVGVLRGYSVVEMLKAAISLAVAAVPEGLPTVATTTLALGIRDMRRHRVLVRQLDAVETLGAAQVFCLDKTGTLTENRMSVVQVATDSLRLNVIGGTFRRGGRRVSLGRHDELVRLVELGVLCNEAEYGVAGARSLGSPTEVALLRLAHDAGIDVAGLRERHALLRTEPRSENRNYMMTWHRTGDERTLVAVKGSPSEVLALCRWTVRGSSRAVLTDDERLAIGIENERMAGSALRVLGFAYADADDPDAAADDLTWAGLAGMADPVREGAADLIRTFHEAGIKTVMITGDQTATASAIGKELNVSGSDRLEILDSTHLERSNPEVLAAIARRVHVFARVSPAHKLQVVQALQSGGYVVAMTGDGINDGPALKAADIGIAMGDTGTDVARTVADVVLQEDELRTMVVAVSRGRTIYGNIRKSIHFLLATNMSEIAVMLGAIAAGAGPPLSPMQLLWINLVTDIFPGLALALEPNEPTVMKRPPRDPQAMIIEWSDFKRIGFEAGTLSAAALGAYGYGVYRYGLGPQANTMAFMSLTLGQLLHSLSCRSETHGLFRRERLPPNPYLNLALGGCVGLQLLSTALPPLRALLGIAPLTALDAAVLGAAAVGPLFINELTKVGPPDAVADESRSAAPVAEREMTIHA